MDIAKDFVHLARLSLEGRPDDAELLVKRSLRRLARERPDLAEDARSVLGALAKGPLRRIQKPIPVDDDSRLELLRRVEAPQTTTSVWSAEITAELESILDERIRADVLAEVGLSPTRAVLFVGPPGVGKTLAAHWLAEKLERPLFVLDLAAVMSSFLGRTGTNLRTVLDYARSESCVLLLDEFDAIAKRRDDGAEVGELKRLVTVLLQAVDDWPSSGLLVAATNHPELLDPASWRRFEKVLPFPLPDEPQVERLLIELGVSVKLAETCRALLLQSSHADITLMALSARRTAVLKDRPFEDVLLERVVALARDSSVEVKLAAASALMVSGRSQREISGLTGLSRDTIRKRLKKPPTSRRTAQQGA